MKIPFVPLSLDSVLAGFRKTLDLLEKVVVEARERQASASLRITEAEGTFQTITHEAESVIEKADKDITKAETIIRNVKALLDEE